MRPLRRYRNFARGSLCERYLICLFPGCFGLLPFAATRPGPAKPVPARRSACASRAGHPVRQPMARRFRGLVRGAIGSAGCFNKTQQAQRLAVAWLLRFWEGLRLNVTGFAPRKLHFAGRTAARPGGAPRVRIFSAPPAPPARPPGLPFRSGVPCPRRSFG